MSFDAADPNIPPTPDRGRGATPASPLPRNSARLSDGDLLLVDAGCELDGYASDVTRTFPVNGKFSGPQKDIYELVLAGKRAVAAVKPGNRWDEPHNTAVNRCTRFIDLPCNGTVEQVIETEDYKPSHAPHRIGWVWSSRCGEYKSGGEWRRLEPGMTLTVEPGCYVPRPTTSPRRSGTSACASKTMWRYRRRVRGIDGPRRSRFAISSARWPRLSCRKSMSPSPAADRSLCTALALSASGVSVARIADPAKLLTALSPFPTQPAVLERLGAWSPAASTAIQTIHVSQQGFGRPCCRCADYGLPALGYVTPYFQLVVRLAARTPAIAGNLRSWERSGDGIVCAWLIARTSAHASAAPRARRRRTESRWGPRHRLSAAAVVAEVTAEHAAVGTAGSALLARGLSPCSFQGPLRFGLEHETATAEKLQGLPDPEFLARLRQASAQGSEISARQAAVRSFRSLLRRTQLRPRRESRNGNAAQRSTGRRTRPQSRIA